MKLKSQWFSHENDLIRFVTNNNILKENVQTITACSNYGYMLFYWG